MKVVTIASQKGGTGKTTLCLNLGVLANDGDDGSAVLVDADEHGGLSHWRVQRAADSPVVANLDRGLDDVIERARAAGAAWCVIDTPAGTPTTGSATHRAIRAADLVVMPTKPNMLDIRTAKPTVEAVRNAGVAACFVLNEAPARGSTPDAARTALAGYDLPCCPTAVVHRAAVAHSTLRGQAVHEYAPRDKAAAEMRDVWTWIRSHHG